ncbi:hypothetical protein LJC20_03420 [Eubacteriales bacterium OttesenSCG-928-M02]|nr:hypothetical protein [Eubacteriales bacterium OttesenSCG-928-M02]
MTTAIITAIFLIGGWVDYWPTKGTRGKKEKRLYIALTAVAFAVLVLRSLSVPIPSPNLLIKAAVQALFPVQ